VDNQTDHALYVYSRPWYEDTLYVNIAPAGTRLVVWNVFGIGADTESYLDQLQLIPLDSLSIRLGDSLDYRGDALDFDRWEKRYPGQESSLGRVILSVRPTDF
jgi:hypothetical protein